MRVAMTSGCNIRASTSTPSTNLCHYVITHLLGGLQVDADTTTSTVATGGSGYNYQAESECYGVMRGMVVAA